MRLVSTAFLSVNCSAGRSNLNWKMAVGTDGILRVVALVAESNGERWLAGARGPGGYAVRLTIHPGEEGAEGVARRLRHLLRKDHIIE